MTAFDREERWRVGRKVGRTIYRQLGPEPSDDDPLIGVMDTTELALSAVHAFNWRQRIFSHNKPFKWMGDFEDQRRRGEEPVVPE